MKNQLATVAEVVEYEIAHWPQRGHTVAHVLMHDNDVQTPEQLSRWHRFLIAKADWMEAHWPTRLRRPLIYLECLKAATRYHAVRSICKTIGHNVEDRSTAGPDSGNMDHCCSRCGQAWHMPLY